MPSSRGSGTDHAAGIEIGPLTEQDLAQILAIERISFSSPWSRESFLSGMRQPRARNLVARRSGRVMGYLCAWVVAGELKIDNLAVHPAHRRLGIGGRLLLAALDRARSEGCFEATLEVRPSNEDAARLYRRHGFREVGRRRAYYPDTGEDAVLMTLTMDRADGGAP